MKTIFNFFLLLLLPLGLYAQVKIGDNITDISPYALLELESNTKGLIIPRMDTQSRDKAFDIDTPTGTLIFNTDEQSIQTLTFEKEIGSGKFTNNKIWISVTRQIISSLTQPTNPQNGDLFYDNELNVLSIWMDSSGAWIPLSSESKTTYKEVIIAQKSPLEEEASMEVDSIASGMLYANTQSGKLYMRIDSNSSEQPEAWMMIGRLNNTQESLVYNGISVSPLDEIEWGGKLLKPTEIISSAINTFALKGLQTATATHSHTVVVVDQKTGVLRTQSIGSLHEQFVSIHIASTNGERFFYTPKKIENPLKISVFRNGVQINFSVINQDIIGVEPAASCFLGDEIKIIQTN